MLHDPDTINDALREYTTRTRIVITGLINQSRNIHDIEKRVKAIADAIDRNAALAAEADKKKSRKARGLWDAIWSGLGTIKSKGDGLFKD